MTSTVRKPEPTAQESVSVLNIWTVIWREQSSVGADSLDTERTYLDAKGIECRERQRENE